MDDRDRGFDLEKRVSDLEAAGTERTLTPSDRVGERGYFAQPVSGNLPVLGGEEQLVFGSNNYLGLTGDRRVQDAARQAAATVGTGAGASRVTTGDTLVHRDLERVLAEVTAADRALTFSSGYAATVGTIAALAPDVVFTDELNPAGLVDGCQLAGTETVQYDHCDPTSLRTKLERRAARADTTAASWLIVTSSVFSTDGVVAPLADLCDLADEFGAWVMVDETHASGLYANGGGVVQAEGLDSRVQIQLGALSAALASQGGYVAGSDALIEWMIAEARSFVHSTGLAPPAAAAASEALHIARHGSVRERLWENVSHLRDGLESMGYQVVGDSQILPVLVGDRVDALALAGALRDRNVIVTPLQPPAVPDGTSRLRVTPVATHTEDDIVACLEAFKTGGQELGLL